MSCPFDVSNWSATDFLAGVHFVVVWLLRAAYLALAGLGVYLLILSLSKGLRYRLGYSRRPRYPIECMDCHAITFHECYVDTCPRCGAHGAEVMIPRAPELEVRSG